MNNPDICFQSSVFGNYSLRIVAFETGAFRHIWFLNQGVASKSDHAPRLNLNRWRKSNFQLELRRM